MSFYTFPSKFESTIFNNLGWNYENIYLALYDHIKINQSKSNLSEVSVLGVWQLVDWHSYQIMEAHDNEFNSNTLLAWVGEGTL